MKFQDVIILHGWNLSGERFTPLLSVLKKKGFRVFAPDFPGFGKEPPPDTSWHVSDYADFLDRYIQRNKITNPVLIGHSFGGRVALKYVEAHPTEIKKLILTGTPGFSPIPSKKLMVFLLISKIGGYIFSLPGLKAIEDDARKFLYKLAGAREFLRAEGVMRQTFKYVVADDLRSSMKSIAIPCLLVWGEYDSIVPVSIAVRMEKSISGATLTVISGADHGVPFHQPDTFVSSIADFLRA